MAKRDCYDVLGVPRSASKDDIKKAYRKLALKYHPDKTKGDKSSEEKFKEASEAYHILSDQKRKANYDQFGHAAFEGSGGGGQGFGGFDTSSLTYERNILIDSLCPLPSLNTLLLSKIPSKYLKS